MEDDLLDLQDDLQAIERSHARTGRLIARLHQKAAALVQKHGAAMGLDTDVIANITGPKTPPADD